MSHRALAVVTLSAAILLPLGCSTITDGPERNGRMDHTMSATVWYQTSAEMRALSYQAYALARLRLQQHLAAPRPDKPLAIITDVDETLLDNSPHSVKLIQTGETYPRYWKEWVERAQAQPLPGAVDFLKYADSQGVAIFYVTNRDERYRAATIENLRRDGFPQADSAHMFMREDGSGKEGRRKHIEETHAVVLLIGDNLNDFSSLFEKKTIRERKRVADEMRRQFGDRFIVLPNPLYGEWEGAVYKYNWSISDAEKQKRRLDALQSF